MTFNNAATPDIVQKLARNVTYWNIYDVAVAGITTRNTTFTVSDGDGGTSHTATGDSITVESLSDVPVLTDRNTNDHS